MRLLRPLTCALLAAALGCGADSSPERRSLTAPSGCINLSGTWQATYSTLCGTSGKTTVNVTQKGCAVSFAIGDVGDFAVPALGGSDSASMNVVLDRDCGGRTSGDLVVRSRRRLQAPFGDGAGCCRHGSITLTR